MVKKKLISIRMDENSIQKLDALASRHYYWSRSQIIDQIVGHVLNDADPKTLYDIIRNRYFTTSNDKITYVH